MPSTRDNALPGLPQRWLFVPGDDADRLEAALTSGADAIVVDLEEFTPAAGRQIAIRRFAAFARRLAASPSGLLYVSIRWMALMPGGEMNWRP